MRPKDRSADRHDPDAAKSVSVRLGTDDFNRLETTRTAKGISRRAAVIAAIREWIGRNETAGTEGAE